MPLNPEIKKNIFNKLKKELEKCCPPLINKIGSENAIEIIGNTAVPYGYKKEIIPGMFFASAVVRKDMVSFYFFPCYNPAEFSSIAPKLFKCLKGKTCFNIKKEEEVDEKELAALFKKGIQVWKKSGYVK